MVSRDVKSVSCLIAVQNVNVNVIMILHQKPKLKRKQWRDFPVYSANDRV